MEKSDIIDKIMRSDFLTPREKKILQMRLHGYTLNKIGGEIGVTRERIRQIGEKIKRKLKNNLSKEELNIWSHN